MFVLFYINIRGLFSQPGTVNPVPIRVPTPGVPFGSNPFTVYWNCNVGKCDWITDASVLTNGLVSSDGCCGEGGVIVPGLVVITEIVDTFTTHGGAGNVGGGAGNNNCEPVQ